MFGYGAPMLETTAAQLLARVARAQHGGRAPSLVAGVVRDGGLAWSAGRGDVAQPHTDVQYRIGSITKTITAVAVLRLRDAGRLDLDDDLERHLPGTALGRRTIGQLLSHMAGATSERPGPWWERTPAVDMVLTDADRVHAAGRRFHYSNLGYGLLGEVLAEAHGRAWADVVQDEVLAPLGMTRTTPRPSPPAAQGYAVHPWADVVLAEPEHDAGSMAAAGQLWSTLDDLSALAAFLLGDGADVLAADTLAEMFVPSGGGPDGTGWAAYGLGVMVAHAGGRTRLGHGGSMPGFLAGVAVDRDAHVGAVSMQNATSGGDPGLLGDLIEVVAAAEPWVTPPWRPAPSVDEAALALTGPWYWGPAPAFMTLRDGLLQLTWRDDVERTCRFRPRADGSWVGMDEYYAGETMRPAADGRSFELATFVFTRAPYAPPSVVPGGVDADGWHAR